MKDKEAEKRIALIAEAVAGINHHEWSRVKLAIDKKFSSASSKIVLEDAEELKAAIKMEI